MTGVAKDLPLSVARGQGSDHVPAPRGCGNTAGWLQGLEGFPRVEAARAQDRPESDPGIMKAGFQRDRPARFCDPAFNAQSLGAPRTLTGAAC